MSGLSLHARRGQAGFSLVEILVVCAIVAVLAAIAIPVAINQRAKANDASMRADLYSVSTGFETALSAWRGIPPVKTPLQWNSATKTWSLLSNGTTGATVVSGTAQNTMAGTMWTDGSYCIKSTDPTNTSLFYNSRTKAISSTDCLTADTPLGGNGTIPGTTAVTVPAQPTGLTVTNPSDNVVNVSWTAVSGATSYTVSITGVSPSTTTNTTLSATNVPPGTVTVAVRAVNANGSSQATTGTITVTGGSLLSGLAVSGASNLSGGGALSGTFTGNPTFSGNPNFSGNPTFNAGLNANGTAAFAAVQFGGILETTAAAGGLEFGGTSNGGVLYYTPRGTARTAVRGSLMASINSALTLALANVTTAQPLFPTVNGNASGGQTIPVAANTTYDVDCSFSIAGMTATARAVSVTFAPTTASVNLWGLTSTATLAAAGTPTAPLMNSNTGSGGTPSIALNTATVASTGAAAIIKGQIRIGTAGTLQPQATFSTASPGTGTYTMPGSYCAFTPLGSDTMTVNP